MGVDRGGGGNEPLLSVGLAASQPGLRPCGAGCATRVPWAPPEVAGEVFAAQPPGRSPACGLAAPESKGFWAGLSGFRSGPHGEWRPASWSALCGCPSVHKQ